MLDMKNCKTFLIAIALGASLCLGGCVTFTFFPYESATKAADKVLDDILPADGTSEDAAKVAETRKP